jgi:hypothetical protein
LRETGRMMLRRDIMRLDIPRCCLETVSF